MKKIAVIGSLNMDLVATAERFPNPGETLIGKEFRTFPGGKGANQAVAVGRLQADVAMVGMIGDDLYGKQDLLNLEENGVNHQAVGIAPGTSSGIALIEVDGSGENQIVIIPGANYAVDWQFIDEQTEFLSGYDIFLFQLEIPLDTVIHAIKKLKEQGKIVIIDPAPARVLPDEIYPYFDYLTPNETEIGLLAQQKAESPEEMLAAANVLIAKGVGAILLKVGKDGAYIINAAGTVHVPGYEVKAVDTTGAGDSFNAGFAVALSRGGDLYENVRFANAVGALATTAQGAQSAMPDWKQVQSLLGIK
jgi:ribokinase